VYRSQVISDSSGIVHDGMAISAARGRTEQKVTSPFDSSTRVSY
jgi:hypothetical protein